MDTFTFLTQFFWLCLFFFTFGVLYSIKEIRYRRR